MDAVETVEDTTDIFDDYHMQYRPIPGLPREMYVPWGVDNELPYKIRDLSSISDLETHISNINASFSTLDSSLNELNTSLEQLYVDFESFGNDVTYVDEIIVNEEVVAAAINELNEKIEKI